MSLPGETGQSIQNRDVKIVGSRPTMTISTSPTMTLKALNLKPPSD